MARRFAKSYQVVGFLVLNKKVRVLNLVPMQCISIVECSGSRLKFGVSCPLKHQVTKRNKTNSLIGCWDKNYFHKLHETATGVKSLSGSKNDVNDGLKGQRGLPKTQLIMSSGRMEQQHSERHKERLRMTHDIALEIQTMHRSDGNACKEACEDTKRTMC